MTHDELLARINEASPADKIDANWQSALCAVVELHKPIDVDFGHIISQIECANCKVKYPCETIQAIEKELR